jgi:fumarylacetoacetase
LFGTGTISGPDPGTEGSLLELTRRGANRIALPGGETRGFLEDGDTVVIRGRAVRGAARVGFGELTGTVVG